MRVFIYFVSSFICQFQYIKMIDKKRTKLAFIDIKISNKRPENNVKNITFENFFPNYFLKWFFFLKKRYYISNIDIKRKLPYWLWNRCLAMSANVLSYEITYCLSVSLSEKTNSKHLSLSCSIWKIHLWSEPQINIYFNVYLYIDNLRT